MTAHSVPTFHVPDSHVAAAAAADAWKRALLQRPEVIAAGRLVIVDPLFTTVLDLRTQTGTQSATPPGAWQPGAASNEPPA